MAGHEVEAIRKILTNHSDVRLAILFGSMAAGREEATSDIDLALDMGRSMSAAERIRIIEELANQLGRPVDLIDLRRVGQPLLSRIVRTGRKLVGSTTAYGDLIKRHLFEEHDFMPYLRRINRARRLAWIKS